MHTELKPVQVLPQIKVLQKLVTNHNRHLARSPIYAQASIFHLQSNQKQLHHNLLQITA
jgi:hypothetical protein